MKPIMTRTQWVVILAVFLLIVYDIWAITNFGYDETISATVYRFSKDYPIVAFAGGIVCGHLWWPNETACK